MPHMHNQFMRQAFQNACLGRGLCAPNPSVGAVLVSDNQVIREAYHKGAGNAHAEQLVLEQLEKSLRPATLYVTLEPCNHWGRTPPCVQAIIEAGIQRVVYAYADPNPIVAANNTPEQLRAAGIEVLHYPLPEIDAFYQSYTYWTKTKKPWVTVKMAQSIDGKIAGSGGQRCQLSNEICAAFTHEHRKNTDCILTTAQTIKADNPYFTARINGSVWRKAVAILDRQLTLTPKYHVFDEAKNSALFYDKNLPLGREYDNCRYYPVSVSPKGLNLEEVLSHLGQNGVHDLWVEAGGVLFTALHEQGLVHRTYLYLVPKVLGDDAIKGYHSAGLLSAPHRLHWQEAGDNMIACFDWL